MDEVTTTQPWRRNLEFYAALAWCVASVAVWRLIAEGRYGWAALGLLGITIYFAAYRASEAGGLLRVKKALIGKPVTVVSPEYVKEKAAARPDCLWLGWGFEWTREQAQLAYELERYDIERLVPLWMRLIWRKGPTKGTPLLHGVQPDERDIYIPYETLEGHCFIPATTGAMKTRMLSLIALQAILKDPKETVIIVDPKGDVELLKLMRWASRVAGREDDFCFLHPAFPRKSIRLDLMKNWTTTTEGASRVAEMVGGDESSGPFKAFGWQVINNIIQGMLAVGERPQLTSLRRYIEGGPDQLIRRVIASYVAHQGKNPDAEIGRYMGEAKRVRGRTATTPVESIAAVLYYKRECQETQPMAVIDGLLTMYEHDAAHFSKMITNLQPIMAMLTSDELAALLSPDYNDPNDPREILDNGRIVRQGRVFYLGLHSMPDATVSEAIGSLYLADLVAVLGERYVRNETEPHITLGLDEANEIVNPPLVQILNKGRSSGLMAYFLTQTIEDFVAKYGAAAPAHQLLGNANNTIFGRSEEPETIKFVMDKIGETIIRQTQDQFGVKPVTGHRNIANYQADYGIRRMDTREPLFRAELCRSIPNLEYMAVLAGHKIVKGRIPVVAEGGR